MDFSWRSLCAGLTGLFVLTGSASGVEFGPRRADNSANCVHHEQRPAQGKRACHRQAVARDPFHQGGLPASSQRRNQFRGQYTDPGLIANSDPAGGQFIHVSVTPDGSKFHVQIGPDGPQREFASR